MRGTITVFAGRTRHAVAWASGCEWNDSDWISRGLRNARWAGWLRKKLLEELNYLINA